MNSLDRARKRKKSLQGRYRSACAKVESLKSQLKEAEAKEAAAYWAVTRTGG